MLASSNVAYKLPVNFYAFQKEFVLASSNLFQSELKSAKVSVKRHFNSVINTYFTSFFIHQPICPKSFTLLAFVFTQEYREKKINKKKAKKPSDQNGFHGTNKYTNGSHGYLRVSFMFVLFPAEM